jgi:Na+/proline symporter
MATNPVVVMLTTLTVALLIACCQPLWQHFVQNAKSDEDTKKVTALVLLFIVVLRFGYIAIVSYLIPIGSRYLGLRSARAIYMHCLSAIRLSLLKRCKEDIAKSQIRIDVAVHFT